MTLKALSATPPFFRILSELVHLPASVFLPSTTCRFTFPALYSFQLLDLPGYCPRNSTILSFHHQAWCYLLTSDTGPSLFYQPGQHHFPCTILFTASQSTSAFQTIVMDGEHLVMYLLAAHIFLCVKYMSSFSYFIHFLHITTNFSN